MYVYIVKDNTKSMCINATLDEDIEWNNGHS